MGIHYSHLSNFERCRLYEWYHYQKKSIREVALLLNRSHAILPSHPLFYCYFTKPPITI
jgi:IS30 family transposase